MELNNCSKPQDAINTVGVCVDVKNGLMSPLYLLKKKSFTTQLIAIEVMKLKINNIFNDLQF